MSIYYFDSSALVKYYVDETGSDWVTEIIDGNDIFIAAITIVEVISAIERRKRAGQISANDAAQAKNDFRSDFSSGYGVIDIARDILIDSSAMVDRHGLRAYDAVQLQSGLRLYRRQLAKGLTHMTFVSADTALNTAAKAEGLSVENPNNH